MIGAICVTLMNRTGIVELASTSYIYKCLIGQLDLVSSLPNCVHVLFSISTPKVHPSSRSLSPTILGVLGGSHCKWLSGFCKLFLSLSLYLIFFMCIYIHLSIMYIPIWFDVNSEFLADEALSFKRYCNEAQLQWLDYENCGQYSTSCNSPVMYSW